MGTQDTPDPVVAESASTPAEAEVTGTTESTPVSTRTDSEPWADFGADKGAEESGTQDTPGSEETPASTGTEPAEVKTDDTVADPEEDVLTELFKDEDEEGKDGEITPEPESESEEDKLDKADPDAMAKSQRNKAATQYTERIERYAKPLKDLKHGKIQPLEVFTALQPLLGDERIAQLKQAAAHDLVDAHPDATFLRAYAVKMKSKDPAWDPKTATVPTLDEIIAGPAQTETASSDVDLSALTLGLDGQIDWDWRDENLDEQFQDDRERVMVKAIRDLESTAKQATADKEAAEKKAVDAEAKTKNVEEAQQTEEQKAVSVALNTRISDFRTSVDSKILPHVLRETGLEVSTDDTPEIVAFKERKAELYQGTAFEKAEGTPSQFERFLENEWSGKAQIVDVYTRIVDNLLKQELATRSGDSAAAKQAADDVKEDRIPLFTLVSKANREFKARYIDPDLTLIGAAWEKKAAPSDKGRDRKEIVSSAAPARQAAPKKQYDTADDVWTGMVDESKEEARAAA